MRSHNIIILSKIENTVTLYADQLKYGYHKLCYFLPDQDRRYIELDRPEITLQNLGPGQYYFYCQNDDGKETGDIKINIYYDTKKERYHKVLLHAGKHEAKYTDIVDSLKTDNPILELYGLYQTTEENKELYEDLLQIFTNDYNLHQEELNFFVDPLFTFDKNTGKIISYNNLSYTFMPYQYDLGKKEWSLLPDHIQYNTSFYQIDEKSSQLYRVSVLSDSNLVRRFYVYQPSGTCTEAILEDMIRRNKNIDEYTLEALSDPMGIISDKYKMADAILYFDTVKPILRQPEIEIGEGRGFTAIIPDYEFIVLSEKRIFLAVLEAEELYNENPCPHKIEIDAPTITVKRQDFLINSDTEYVFYLTDEYGTKLSKITFVSFDEEYPVEEYTETHKRIQCERYARKLYAVFKEHDVKEWEIVSLLLNRYFLNNEETKSFSDYLIEKVTYLDNREYNISLIIQLILLCDLQYFMDIDQDFIQNQTYGKMYKTHVLPRSDTTYIVRVMRINDGIITYDYYRSGNGGTEIRVDKDDIIAIQCINLDTWKMSSIAFYNNRYDGASYFYFPKLEVTVDVKLN